MASYGRNFGFRIPPYGAYRAGRYCIEDALPIGVPVKADLVTGENALGLQTVELATGSQNPVHSGAGILVFEYAPWAFQGDDITQVTYSDKDTAPAGAAVQVVRGLGIKVWLANTDNADYIDFAPDWRSGPRKIVAGLGATPTLEVGDYLTPGVGNDTDGYWAEGNATNGWLRITKVENDRGAVEAETTF